MRLLTALIRYTTEELKKITEKSPYGLVVSVFVNKGVPVEDFSKPYASVWAEFSGIDSAKGAELI